MQEIAHWIPGSGCMTSWGEAKEQTASPESRQLRPEMLLALRKRLRKGNHGTPFASFKLNADIQGDRVSPRPRDIG